MRYQCGNTQGMTQQITPYFEIVNTSSATVSLVGVTMRYYFTSDGGVSPQFVCNYAMIGCNNLNGTFGAWVGTESDTYLEIAFTGGSIGPGGNSGPMQLQVHDATFVTYDQTNDYSFDSTKTSYAEWSNVTLYQSGTLYWGVEP